MADTNSWAEVTPTEPKPGTECLFFGIAHGDYGYTDDKEVVMRGVALPPVQEAGELYPSCRITEATGRYWNGFTPIRYKILK